MEQFKVLNKIFAPSSLDGVDDMFASEKDVSNEMEKHE